MIKRPLAAFLACSTACLAAPDDTTTSPPAGAGTPRHGTITENTPSIPQYFTWINNTNEGAIGEQTLTNLRFFKWLRDEYGMQLGIYAFDAGAIDSQEYYGRMDTERFRKQFPDGFGNIAEMAKSFECRLGLWGGPDGFGDTPEEEAARTGMLVSLCRDYGLQLFKFDSVCGQLRDDKQQAFNRSLILAPELYGNPWLLRDDEFPKLADLQPAPVPADAEPLYEAACFTAPNDALEVQSLRRSGPSRIAPVIEARKAFFEQELFWRRGIWDKYLFDSRDETFLSVFHYRRDKRLSGGCLRIDLGTACEPDTIRLKTLRDPRSREQVPGEKARAELAWQAKVSIPSHPAPNSYLCVALNGEHGKNGAYAALRMDGEWIGAPQRAVSYPAVVFEYPPRNPFSNYTYFFPVTKPMHGRTLDVLALGLAGCDPALEPEVWTTTYPHPYASVEMVLD